MDVNLMTLVARSAEAGRDAEDLRSDLAALETSPEQFVDAPQAARAIATTARTFAGEAQQIADAWTEIAAWARNAGAAAPGRFTPGNVTRVP